VRFRDGVPAVGVSVHATSRTAPGERGDVTDARGRFSLPFPAIQDVTITCDVPGGEGVRFENGMAPRWDVGDIVIADVASLVLATALDADVARRLQSTGEAAFEVRVQAADSQPRRSLCVQELAVAHARAWQRAEWLPIVPVIEVTWGLRTPHSPVVAWFERQRLQLDHTGHSYGTARLELGGDRLVTGSVEREGGQVSPGTTVRIVCTPAVGRPRLFVTRTDGNGAFVCVLPKTISAVLWAEIGSHRGDEAIVAGGRHVHLHLPTANNVRLRVVEGSSPLSRFYLGRFYLDTRADSDHPLAQFVRERDDGTAVLAVERVAAGDRWFFYSQQHGPRAWTAPVDIQGGGAPVELQVDQMAGTIALRVRLGPGSRALCAAPAELRLIETDSARRLLHRATIAPDSASTMVDGVFGLRFDYELTCGGTRVASGIVDASRHVDGIADLEIP
jgi:hypothetical protein